jgi:hypothetical protein
MSTMSSAEEGLGAALRDPFEFYDSRDGTHVLAASDWLDWLQGNYPLVTLNSQRFTALNEGGMSTYPLGEFIDSILRDEGISEGQMLHGLLSELLQARTRPSLRLT